MAHIGNAIVPDTQGFLTMILVPIETHILEGALIRWLETALQEALGTVLRCFLQVVSVSWVCVCVGVV